MGFPLKPRTDPPFPKPASCAGCPLYKEGKGFVYPSGAGTSGVLYVAEAPGENEAKKGAPLVGPSGVQFDSILRRARIERETLKLDNVLHCRPPRNELAGAPYEGEAIAHCAHFLDETIERMKPKVIVALGNIAMRRLTGHSGIKRYRGFVLDGPDGVPVIPTFHPSFLLPRRGEESSAKWTGVVIWDLLKAHRIAKEGFKRLPVRYLLDPPPDQATNFLRDYERALKANPQLALAWDIETPGKLTKKDEEELDEIDYQIIRVSFAFEPRYAMTIPWQGPWMPLIREILGTEGPKIGWNDTHFDRPVVANAGVEVRGELHDAMNAWHVLQPNLPKKLEVVASFYADHLTPWKHLSKSDPEYYSAVDADATICNWEGIVRGLRAVAIPSYEEKAA